jgi:hypothetical protein
MNYGNEISHNYVYQPPAKGLLLFYWQFWSEHLSVLNYNDQLCCKPSVFDVFGLITIKSMANNITQ